MKHLKKIVYKKLPIGKEKNKTYYWHSIEIYENGILKLGFGSHHITEEIANAIIEMKELRGSGSK